MTFFFHVILVGKTHSVVHSTLVLASLFHRYQWRLMPWSTPALVTAWGSIPDLVVVTARLFQKKGEQSDHCNPSKTHSMVARAVLHDVGILLAADCCQ